LESSVVMPMKAVGMALESDMQERVLAGIKKTGSHEFMVPENLMGTQWYADYKNWLKIDSDGKFICWPVGCVKAKCARNTGVNQDAANREMRRIQTLKPSRTVMSSRGVSRSLTTRGLSPRLVS